MIISKAAQKRQTKANAERAKRDIVWAVAMYKVAVEQNSCKHDIHEDWCLICEYVFSN